ncbi:MAG: phosphotransferase, partial [Acidimicrobiales bacterium]|nr:phosphotransferase [Acidimicrobiales bacterium]
LTAVIDFGDLTSGDPASDLAVAWMAFEPSERLRLIAGLPNVDRSTWRRARGWALALGAIVMVHADDDPVLATTARAALRRVLDGTDGE